MTDQTEALPEPQWGNPGPGWVTANEMPEDPPQDWLPEAPKFPAASASYALANHAITISITPGKPPMVVVRGNTGAEINGLLEELEAEGVYIQMAAADQQLKGSAPPAETIMRQLGATAMPPQGGPVAQQMAQAYPTPQFQPGPPQQSPGQPPFGGGGFQPQQQGGWGAPQQSSAPAGWFAVKIPFQAKAEGDQLKAHLKSTGQYMGNMKWDKENTRWLVSPAIVQMFAKWNPMPA